MRDDNIMLCLRPRHRSPFKTDITPSGSRDGSHNKIVYDIMDKEIIEKYDVDGSDIDVDSDS